MNYDASFRNGIRRANGTIVSARAVGKVENDDRADWREAWALFQGDAAYVWHGALHAGGIRKPNSSMAATILSTTGSFLRGLRS